MVEMVAPERVGMSLADFLEATRNERFELIDGEKKPLMSEVFGHGKMIATLFKLLLRYLAFQPIGEVYPTTTFVLPDYDESNWVKGSRIPDLMFVRSERLQQYETANLDNQTQPLALVPDLVIEVVSPNDRYSEIQDKAERYLADGVRLVWVVDPQRRKVDVYRSESGMQTFKETDSLTGGDVLPNFQMLVKDMMG